MKKKTLTEKTLTESKVTENDNTEPEKAVAEESKTENKQTEQEAVVTNDSLSARNLIIPSCYKEIFLKNYRYFILSSGRISGKTSILVAAWWTSINEFKDRDIIILQATSIEIKDSIINEISKFLRNSGFNVGEDPSNEWYVPLAKDRIVHRGQIGATFFFPMTDSSGGQRTRGLTTQNKVSLVLYEEVQKNKDANIVEQSLATFIRQLDLEAKIIIVGNNETRGHWFVDFVKNKRQLKDWCYIYANCYDIWALLNSQTKDYIESFKKNNYIEFRRIFLGDIDAKTSDVVFPQFTREKSYLKANQLREQYIIMLIIGVDHATADDKFAVVPVAILEDGTTQTLEVCCDDPKETNRALAPTEQCEILEKFVDFLDSKYGFFDNNVPMVISIDGAAAPFIQQVRHLKRTANNKRLWNRIKVNGFTKKKKDVNLGIIKSAFAFGVLTILNEGSTTWDGSPNKHLLVKEIEAQRYKNFKLDPKVPNDLCDALEYGLIPYYSNCYNLSFPSRIKTGDSHYDEIQKTFIKRGK